MALRFFSDKKRPVHFGSFPLEQLARLNSEERPDLDKVAPFEPLSFHRPDTPHSIVNAMAALKESMQAPPGSIDGHSHAIVLLYDMPRDPRPDEPGSDWLEDAQAHRACLRASETAVVLANYIRLLGWDAKAHTATSSDVELNRLTVAAGLATVEAGRLVNPDLGDRFGVAIVTTDYAMATDAPLARQP